MCGGRSISCGGLSVITRSSMKWLGVSVSDQSQSLIGQNPSILYYCTIPVCWSVPSGIQAYIYNPCVCVCECVNLHGWVCFGCWNEIRKPGWSVWWTGLISFILKALSYKDLPVTPAQCSACDRDNHLFTRHTHSHTRGVPNGSISRQGCLGPQGTAGDLEREQRHSGHTKTVSHYNTC